jgi:Flp pilus assembly pilin Flp
MKAYITRSGARSIVDWQATKNPLGKEGYMMMKLHKIFRAFVKDEQGLETVEYAVMTALVVAALITAIGLLTAAVSGRFDAVTTVVGGIG